MQMGPSPEQRAARRERHLNAAITIGLIVGAATGGIGLAAGAFGALGLAALTKALVVGSLVGLLTTAMAALPPVARRVHVIPRPRFGRRPVVVAHHGHHGPRPGVVVGHGHHRPAGGVRVLPTHGPNPTFTPGARVHVTRSTNPPGARSAPTVSSNRPTVVRHRP